MIMSKNYTNAQKASLNTSLNLFIKFISMVSAFIMKTVMIKSMGIQYTGISSVFTDLLMLFSFAELGIGSAIVFELYRPIEEKDYKKIAQLMNFFKTAYQFIGTAIFVIGLILLPFLNNIITDIPDVKENISLIYILYLLNTVCSYFLIYQSTLLTASQENFKISLIQGIFFLIRLVVSSFLLIHFKNFLLYLTCDILLIILQNIIIFKISSNKFPELKKFQNEKLNTLETKKLLSNVGALALYQISNVVINSTDSIIISSVLGTGIVAFFANYRLIVRSVDSFASQITVSLTPTLGNFAIKNKNSQKEMFEMLNFFIFWITYVSALLIFFLTKPFITFWLGDDFILEQHLLFLMVADYVVVNLARPVATIRNANGLFTQGKYRPLIMTILSIIFSVILVRLYGISGAIMGTLLSRILTQVWYDPYIIFSHVFKENVKGYFYKYCLQILFILGSGYAIKKIIEFMSVYNSINNKLFEIIVHFVIVLIFSNLFFFFIFGKSEVFRKIKMKFLSKFKRKNLK